MTANLHAERVNGALKKIECFFHGGGFIGVDKPQSLLYISVHAPKIADGQACGQNQTLGGLVHDCENLAFYFHREFPNADQAGGLHEIGRPDRCQGCLLAIREHRNAARQHN